MNEQFLKTKKVNFRYPTIYLNFKKSSLGKLRSMSLKNCKPWKEKENFQSRSDANFTSKNTFFITISFISNFEITMFYYEQFSLFINKNVYLLCWRLIIFHFEGNFNFNSTNSYFDDVLMTQSFSLFQLRKVVKLKKKNTTTPEYTKCSLLRKKNILTTAGCLSC